MNQTQMAKLEILESHEGRKQELELEFLFFCSDRFFGPGYLSFKEKHLKYLTAVLSVRFPMIQDNSNKYTNESI